MKKQICTMMMLIILVTAGCSTSADSADDESPLIKNPYSETEFLLGTVVTIKIYDEGKESVLNKVFDRIEELEQQMTANENGSEVAEINEQAGIEPVHVSEDVWQVIDQGKHYSEMAEGSFDIAVGPLTSLWNIGMEDARKPSQDELDDILPLIDYEKIELDEAEQTVMLKETGMRLDLGAIAKGYIADEVMELLDEEGVTTAVIDLGGNIYVMGNQTSGDPWVVGVQNPFSGKGETVGRLTATDQSIVTSGIYERYLEVDGEIYHHLLNPKTGYPFEGELASVSVVSDHSVDGDGLSTLLFSKGLEEGIEFIQDFDGAEAIFVMKDKSVYITDGLVDNFELTDEDFTLIE
ncbi:FAD:protein FMN transferase [Oceanobacillus neutriphilus]|uniref:FAD:protein FMN transferase n=1 Tax=Oceanobacillus neutriphilus TaxID=531815 RepID=A0ABQ2NRR6_9BACI|nr:FAD:protein FMN transferase [Oceanobacillus neutriphilus]GGP08402.1 FAD:protein FMN transferase [Oceanobacillus neutriphilus]